MINSNLSGMTIESYILRHRRWSCGFQWVEFMFMAAPQSNSSENHKEKQGEDQQDWEEVACRDVKTAKSTLQSQTHISFC